MAWTEIAQTVLAKRYLIKDDNGNPTETPEDMFRRVARTISKGNSDDEENFYQMMVSGIWLPNSPTLMNAGRPLGQLSACFVLPVEDALTNEAENGIYDTLRNMAIIHQSGGGTGFDFSDLRGAGSSVKSTTGVASGPVSFMRLFDTSTEVVKQGGTRRGANMAILRFDHPDIEGFVTCKADTSHITNFNISVGVTDEFMRMATQGLGDYASLLDLIVQQAWSTGEPGLFFLDTANATNVVRHLGDYTATNPCGEQPLLPYDVCNLGSLNLGKFVQDGQIDYGGIQDYATISMRFLDNVIDVNNYPLPEIEQLSKLIRRVGNGVMGWADMLVKLGIPYDSPEALALAHDIAELFTDACQTASENLATERGWFPEWPRTAIRYERRNCNMTTVAPTGTISMIAGCSSGIEPHFAAEITRNQAGETMKEINGYASSPAFRTSEDVSTEYHVRHQAAWQAYVDSAVSKTINMPASATPDDVRDAYTLAWTLGCKGITVYRDGSRPGQVLSREPTEPECNDKFCVSCN